MDKKDVNKKMRDERVCGIERSWNKRRETKKINREEIVRIRQVNKKETKTKNLKCNAAENNVEEALKLEIIETDANL